MRLVLVGPPGTGKDAQAKLLSRVYRIPSVSIGAVLRKEMNRRTKEGVKVRKYVLSGDMAPSGLVYGILKRELHRYKKKGYILNGFPRTKQQIKQLGKVDCMLYIKTPKHELFRRLLKRHRKDDDKKLVLHRFEVYRKETKPVIGYYKKKGLVVTVNGNQTIKQVHKEILDKLRLFLENVRQKHL